LGFFFPAFYPADPDIKLLTAVQPLSARFLVLYDRIVIFVDFALVEPAFSRPFIDQVEMLAAQADSFRSFHLCRRCCLMV
jgi:hypothetical protein